MNIRIETKENLSTSSILIPMFEKTQVDLLATWVWFTPSQKKFIRQFLDKSEPLSVGEFRWMTVPHGNGITQVLFLGFGKKSEYTLRVFRLRMRQMIRQATAVGVHDLTLALADVVVEGVQIELLSQQLVEQLYMAEYTFARFKSKSKKQRENRIHIICSTQVLKAVRQGVKVGEVIGVEVNRVRDLCNTPGGEMTPKGLAKRAKIMAQESTAQFEVFGEKRMKQLGMGGILGVSRGSAEEAQFITVKHLGGPSGQAPIVLVGKGITFDTGGLNLKPDKAMDGMHLDMSGAAAVIGAVCVVAKLKLRLNVMAIAPAAENMPSGSGYRPGDVLSSMSGKTIEVRNTDAEGRIILADALTYVKRLHPKLVVDVATLTGAAWVALGYRASALFTTEDSLAHAFEHLADESGDYIWRMPLWEEYASEVKGTFGDLQNTGKYPVGGCITAAHFLKNFAQGYPWVHIDMASTMETIDDMFLAHGASGATVRLLVHLLRTSAR